MISRNISEMLCKTAFERQKLVSLTKHVRNPVQVAFIIWVHFDLVNLWFSKILVFVDSCNVQQFYRYHWQQGQQLNILIKLSFVYWFKVWKFLGTCLPQSLWRTKRLTLAVMLVASSRGFTVDCDCKVLTYHISLCIIWTFSFKNLH